mgnify:CR=1 FL=1
MIDSIHQNINMMIIIIEVVVILQKKKENNNFLYGDASIKKIKIKSKKS